MTGHGSPTHCSWLLRKRTARGRQGGHGVGETKEQDKFQLTGMPLSPRKLGAQHWLSIVLCVVELTLDFLSCHGPQVILPL